MGSNFRCSGCDYSSYRWFGRCPQCGAWSTTIEASPEAGESLVVSSLGGPAPPLERFSSGLGELDRILGGGFVPGSVVLLSGEPGIGKSTLLLQVLDGVARGGGPALLVSGEESTDQISMRAFRLGATHPGVQLAASSSLPAIIAGSLDAAPSILVVDSIQTLQDPALDQAAGSLVQVRESAAALSRHAKATGTTVVIAGHVTKEGAVAGPKTLEHVVDTVLSLEGDRSGTLRLLRAVKNRFGSCDETGVFAMTAAGLEAVADPSSMLLADRRAGISGSIVFPALEGTRPLLVEIQALVTHSGLPQPRRVAIGLDQRRLSLLLGVLAEHGGLKFHDKDVFVSSAGGMRIREPAADLAICLALWSAGTKTALDGQRVAFGEVGLGGEVRRVPGTQRRLSEAARLGFSSALAPIGSRDVPSGIDHVPVGNIASAFARSKHAEVTL